MNKLRALVSHTKHRGLLWTILYAFHQLTLHTIYAMKRHVVKKLEKLLRRMDKRRFLAEYRLEGPEEANQPMTRAELTKLQAQYPFYVGTYYKDRWDYISEVIKIIKRESPQSVLELGPSRLPIVKGSDTMDRALLYPHLKYRHDATQVPWPIQDASYDLFIALQVWEHLRDKQPQAFREVMRVSRMAILSFPYRWHCRGDFHHGIDDQQIAEWTLHVEPKETIKVGTRIIYVFEFHGPANAKNMPCDSSKAAPCETDMGRTTRLRFPGPAS